MKEESATENACPKYVQKKVASVSLRKAQKIIDRFDEERKHDWNWALFAIIVGLVVAMSVVLASMI